MKPMLHHLQPGETDFELLGLSASGAALITGLVWSAAGLPRPRCAFHAITGCPCPTCGVTRCMTSLLHGHPMLALAWNPLAFAILIAAAIFNFYAVGVLAAGLPRVRFLWTAFEARLARTAVLVLFAANWAYLIHHGV